MVIFVAKAVIQVLFLTFFYYYLYLVLSSNQASAVFKWFLIYFIIYSFCRFASLSILEYVLKKLLLPFAVFVFIMYQAELRRSFGSGFLMKNARVFRTGKTTTENLDSILDACQKLSQVKRGALIVFSRKVSIKNIINTGTYLDANISSPLIVTIFDHDTPLHDGAVVIQGSKVVSAGCYLPLSSQTEIKQSFGTRHRAALGLAEESDAVIIVVSEETRAISLAYNGNIYYQLSISELKNALLSLLNNVDLSITKIERGGVGNEKK